MIPLAERFAAKVRKTDSCWEWMGTRNTKGYGTISAGPRGSGRLYAHRYAWELVNGLIPCGLCVCHRCDNPCCVRPDHLFLGTKGDNNRDMYAKGRGRPPILSGAKGPNARLTEEDVRIIRREAAAGVSNASLARRFGVGRCNIGCIVNGKTWKLTA